MRIFDDVTTGFIKTIIVKNLLNLMELHLTFNWWTNLTVILRKYCVTLSLCKYYGNIMNMVQRSFLKLQCKKTASRKDEIIRQHSDLLTFFWIFYLKFLINTYKWISFQKSCREDQATHRNMKSLIYIFEKKLIQIIPTNAKTDITSLLCQDEIQTSSNWAKTWNKDF